MRQLLALVDDHQSLVGMSSSSSSPHQSSTLVGGFSRSQWLAMAGGLAGAAFVGYCVYFDHKRRSAPDFREKLRQKRLQEREKRSRQDSIPIPTDAASANEYFLQQVQLGEELLADGKVDEGVRHLCNAMVLCGQAGQLMQIFAQTLPASVFNMLKEQYPIVKKRHEEKMRAVLASRHGDMPGGGGPTELIDDGELE